MKQQMPRNEESETLVDKSSCGFLSEKESCRDNSLFKVKILDNDSCDSLAEPHHPNSKTRGRQRGSSLTEQNDFETKFSFHAGCGGVC